MDGWNGRVDGTIASQRKNPVLSIQLADGRTVDGWSIQKKEHGDSIRLCWRIAALLLENWSNRTNNWVGTTAQRRMEDEGKKRWRCPKIISPHSSRPFFDAEKCDGMRK
jgi:predicted enzyme involved in methoxymalonyl-ACP biosynthesis